MDPLILFFTLCFVGFVALILFWALPLRRRLKTLEKLFHDLPMPIAFKGEDSRQNFKNKAYEHLRSNGLNLGEGDQTLILEGQRHLLNTRSRFIADLGTLHWVEDLTPYREEKRQFESHLKAYRQILDTLSAGVTIYGPDRRLEYFNHAYSRTFDFKEQWLAQKPSLGDVLDDLRARRLLTEYADYNAYKRDQMDLILSMITTQQRLLHLPDGRSIRMITAPHPLGGAFCIFEDVSSMLQLERKYNTQIEVQKISLDNLYEGVAVLGLDNRLRLANPAFLKIWHLSEEGHYVGKHIWDLADEVRGFFKSENMEWADFKTKVIASVTDRHPKRRRIQRADGTILDFSYMPLPDGSHLMSYLDVTEAARSVYKLKAKNRALSRADEMKSALLSALSYEVRTPLQAAKGYAELLQAQAGHKFNSIEKGFCQGISTAVDQLERQVSHVFDYALLETRQENVRLKNLNFINFLKRAASDLSKRNPLMHPRIIVDTQNNNVRVPLDDRRMREVFAFLLSSGLSTQSVHLRTELLEGGRVKFLLDLEGVAVRGDRPQPLGIGSLGKDRQRFAEAYAKTVLSLHGGSFFARHTRGRILYTFTFPMQKVQELAVEETESLNQERSA